MWRISPTATLYVTPVQVGDKSLELATLVVRSYVKGCGLEKARVVRNIRTFKVAVGFVEGLRQALCRVEAAQGVEGGRVDGQRAAEIAGKEAVTCGPVAEEVVGDVALEVNEELSKRVASLVVDENLIAQNGQEFKQYQMAGQNNGTTFEISYTVNGRTVKQQIPAGTTFQTLANGQTGVVILADGVPVTDRNQPVRDGARVEAIPQAGKLGHNG